MTKLERIESSSEQHCLYVETFCATLALWSHKNIQFLVTWRFRSDFSAFCLYVHWEQNQLGKHFVFKRFVTTVSNFTEINFSISHWATLLSGICQWTGLSRLESLNSGKAHPNQPSRWPPPPCLPLVPQHPAVHLTNARAAEGPLSPQVLREDSLLLFTRTAFRCSVGRWSFLRRIYEGVHAQ
jgi:hypothetical protein